MQPNNGVCLAPQILAPWLRTVIHVYMLFHTTGAWLQKVFSHVLHPLTSFCHLPKLAWWTAKIVMRARRRAYCTHDVEFHFWCLMHSVCPCMSPPSSTNTRIPTQIHLYSVHSQKRGFITAAWLQHLAGPPLASVPVWHFCVFVATEWFVYEREEDVWKVCCCLAFVWVCVRQAVFWVSNNGAVILSPMCVCVCMCVCTVLLGVYVWCCLSSRSFPTVTPEGGSRRETDRERKRERVPLLSPHTQTQILIPTSGN